MERLTKHGTSFRELVCWTLSRDTEKRKTSPWQPGSNKKKMNYRIIGKEVGQTANRQRIRRTRAGIKKKRGLGGRLGV